MLCPHNVNEMNIDCGACENARYNEYVAEMMAARTPAEVDADRRYSIAFAAQRDAKRTAAMLSDVPF